MSAHPSLDALVAFYETLSPESLSRLGEHYSPDAHFRDPFHDVVGVEAIGAVFLRMFERCEAPRFRVTGRYPGTDGAMLLWEFSFGRRGGAPLCIRGATHLVFAADGRVAEHVDYWDSLSELWARTPGLGWLARGLARLAT